MGKQWKKKEDSYLLELYNEKTDDGGNIPPSIITILFNEHFERTEGYPPRSHDAITVRCNRLLRDIKNKKETTETRQPSRVHISRTIRDNYLPSRKGKTGSQANSGKSWPPADDNYLIKNFTANEKKQVEVALHLGRSIKACKSRIARIRKSDSYLNTVMRTNSVTTSRVTVSDSLTLLDKVYLYFKYRKQSKIERKRNKLVKKLERLS